MLINGFVYSEYWYLRKRKRNAYENVFDLHKIKIDENSQELQEMNNEEISYICKNKNVFKIFKYIYKNK